MSLAMSARVWQLDLPPTSKLVLLKLADHVHQSGITAWPGIDLIAQDCGLNRRTVQRTLRQLERDGYITATSPASQHRSAVYALTLRGGTVPPLDDAQGRSYAAPEGRHSRHSGAALTTLRGGTVPPEPVEPERIEPETGTDPPNPPLTRGAERARNGSRRKRDRDDLGRQIGMDAIYFTGKYGRQLKARLDEQERESG